jgi:hypothetical protein
MSTWQVVVLRRSQRGPNNNTQSGAVYCTSTTTARHDTYPVKEVLCGGSCVLRGVLDVRTGASRLDSIPQREYYVYLSARHADTLAGIL